MEGKERLQEEVINTLVKNDFNGCIILPTGSGKARIMIELMKIYKPKSVLYLCDNTDLRDKTFREEVIKWGAEEYLDIIDMRCYQTTYKWKEKHYDMLLADEADASMSPKYKLVYFNNHFNKKILVTGTMDEDRLSIVNKIVPVVFRSDIKTVEDKKVVNKANVVFVNYMMTTQEIEQYKRYNKRFAVLLDKEELNNYEKHQLKQLQLSRKLFLQSLNSSRVATRTLLKQLYANHNNKILIFCGLTEQADKISKWSYHGKNDDNGYLEKFNTGEIRVLSVVSKIDRGINLNGVNIVVFESPTRSKTKTMQRSGRARRLEINDVTTLYFMIPWYRTFSGTLKPTIIKNYVLESGEELNLKDAKEINITI